jgi:DNA sulfur modification protein DndD
MILDELILHNFGVYGGRQSVTLTPDARRPITLFGGLNGGGKTTLLDALQLCLYGPSARCSNRNGLAYDDFLRRSIHRRADAPEGAVEVSFRHTMNGEEHQFRLHRSWRASGSSCRERFYVLRNGELDKLATEHWAEQVEDFIPARIAHLFLFDGEKIESYAELDGAPALIATAVQNLLGLDIVERLAVDLSVLERRKRNETIAPSGAAKTEELRSRIEALESTRAQLVRERAASTNALDRRSAQLAIIEERYRREGGKLFEQRAELEGEAVARERQLISAHKELRELAAGAAPLISVGELLEGLVDRAAREDASRRNRETTSAVLEEHKALMTMPAIAALPHAEHEALRAALQARLDARWEAGAHPILLDLSADARRLLDSLITSEVPSARKRLRTALADAREAAAALDHARNLLAASPSYDAIAGVVAAREAAQSEFARLQAEQAERDAEITRLDREIAQLREREARAAEAEARERFEREDVGRLLLHSAKVRATLGRFGEAVVDRHVVRIERLVLESFHQLIRKQTLVTELRIDPKTFVIELRGSDGHPLTPDRLSAGERQLLAIAILWGLGRSSGRPLPTVIDTPMGRLDSIHRAHLVERYFPQASHQVLLLSTDEEITGGYLNALQPSINRMYHLRFDEGEGRTIIEPGYLGAGPSHAH